MYFELKRLAQSKNSMYLIADPCLAVLHGLLSVYFMTDDKL